MALNSETVDSVFMRAFPGWAQRREIARHNIGLLRQVQVRQDSYSYGWQTRGYAGGIASRDRQLEAGHRSLPLDEDTLTRGNLEATRLEAMDLYRNHPIAKSGVKGTVRYLGQSVPTATTAPHVVPADRKAAEMWDEAATDYFLTHFWNSADHQRRPGITFGTHQKWVSTAQWLTGDMGFIWKGDGFYPIEAEEIATPAKFKSNPNIVNGILFNDKGHPTHLYYCDRGRHGGVDLNSYTRVPMASVILCSDYWRPRQIRSIPRLHGVIDALRDHEEIHQRVKNKIKIESGLITKEKAGGVKMGGMKLLANTDGTKTEITNAPWGMRARYTGESDDFTIVDPKSPNSNYVAVMEYDGHLIASGMEIPYEMLMHLFTAGSYTAQRAARVDYMMLLLDLWKWRIDVFGQRVWNVVITQALREEHLEPAPIDARGYSLFHMTQWSTPHMPEVDQGREIRANKDQWNLGKRSMEDFAREQGTTRKQLLAAKKRDIMEAITVAGEINTETGLQLGWRDIINSGAKADADAVVAVDADEGAAAAVKQTAEALLDLAEELDGQARTPARPEGD